MKIGIDVSQVVYGTGVPKYTRNLVSALLSIDKKNEYVFFGGTLRRARDLQEFKKNIDGNFTLKTFPVSPLMAHFLWNKLHLFPIENFLGDIDVFHSSDWTQPPTRDAAKVTTIHDLIPLLYPDETHPKIVAVHKKRLEWVKKEVDHVIAVSESTKKDIIKNLGIPAEKISVVYEAPDDSVKKAGEKAIGEIREKYNLPKEYLLAVGANPRKNIKRIAEAASKINGTPPLVVVGRKSSDVSSHNIIWLGHINDDRDYSTILSGSNMLVYASLYEGFGLPILDAFTCEVPVVTSNLSSMKEVAGEGAVLVDPTDVGEIADGIKKASDSRNELIKKGLVRVKQFSWEKAAKETLKVYMEAAK